jgi:hypothetical protein
MDYKTPTYDNKVRDAETGYLKDGGTMPDTTDADGGAPLRLGGIHNGIRLNLVAKTTCAMAQSDVLTFSLLQCATEDGTFETVKSVEVIGAIGGESWAADTIIASLDVPADSEEYIDYNIACDDTATGTYSVVVELIP